MKKYYYTLFLLVSSLASHIAADPIICFFFKSIEDQQKIAHKLKKPGKLAHHTINGIANHIPIAGIYATYSGYITISDENGEIRFPRKHRDNSANIIVTQSIEPIPLFENTIQQWNLIPQEAAEMYGLVEVYDDKTKEYSWQTHRMNIPHDNKIPSSAIIILAKPKNIVIPSETVKTVKSANLMLPPVYVKKGINIMSQGVHTLTIRYLFRPVEQKIQQTPLQVSTQLLN